MWTSSDSISNPSRPSGEQQRHQGGPPLQTGGESLARNAALLNAEAAYIGKSLLIKGEVSGSEPLYIEGRIEGSISLPGAHVSIGREGVVASNVQAGEVIVRGTLHGNLTAGDRVEIHRDGCVIGQVVTRRISIQDGAHLQGSIEVVGLDPKGHWGNQQ